MNLHFIEMPNKSRKPKATIHVTGKLGFNTEAAKYMNVKDGTYFRIARNKDASKKKDLYFVPADEQELGALKVAKAGQYYYMNLGALFTQMGLEYEKHAIVFCINEVNYEGSDIFQLIQLKNEQPRVKKNRA